MNLDKYKYIVDSYAFKTRIPGLDFNDIKHEMYLKIIEHINDCKARGVYFNERSVCRTVKRCLYKLIRQNVTFEGCCPTTREKRRAISCPHSNVSLDETGKEVDLFENLPSNNANFFDVLTTQELANSFRVSLSNKELEIYELILLGFFKPKDICIEMFGHYDLKLAKVISKHIICIRNKFVLFYQKETGIVLKHGKERRGGAN